MVSLRFGWVTRGCVVALAALVAIPASAQDTAEVHRALNGLTLEDLSASGGKLGDLLNRWFPLDGTGSPCAAADGWLSSAAICEWYAPGADAATAALPDMFVSLSEKSLESVVLWGEHPLDKTVWECRTTRSEPVATICIPRTLTRKRQARLLAEWQATLGRIAGGKS